MTEMKSPVEPTPMMMGSVEIPALLGLGGCLQQQHSKLWPQDFLGILWFGPDLPKLHQQYHNLYHTSHCISIHDWNDGIYRLVHPVQVLLWLRLWPLCDIQQSMYLRRIRCSSRTRLCNHSQRNGLHNYFTPQQSAGFVTTLCCANAAHSDINFYLAINHSNAKWSDWIHRVFSGFKQWVSPDLGRKQRKRRGWDCIQW